MFQAIHLSRDASRLQEWTVLCYSPKVYDLLLFTPEFDALLKTWFHPPENPMTKIVQGKARSEAVTDKLIHGGS